VHPLAAYEQITEGRRRPVRVAELVYVAGDRFGREPPTRAQIDRERELLQKHKREVEIAQGEFLARVLAGERCGAHLVHSMARPTAAALELLENFKRSAKPGAGVPLPFANM